MVSHIPNLGEMLTSPAGDAAPTLGISGHLQLEMYYLVEKCASLSRDAVSPAENTAFLARDVAASSKIGLCETANRSL